MKEQSKSLLVIKTEQMLTLETMDQLREWIAPIAERLDMEPILMTGGLECEVHRDSSGVVEQMAALTQMIGELVIANQELTQALIDEDVAEGDEDSDPVTYLDGSRRAP